MSRNNRYWVCGRIVPSKTVRTEHHLNHPSDDYTDEELDRLDFKNIPLVLNHHDKAPFSKVTSTFRGEDGDVYIWFPIDVSTTGGLYVKNLIDSGLDTALSVTHSIKIFANHTSITRREKTPVHIALLDEPRFAGCGVLWVISEAEIHDKIMKGLKSKYNITEESKKMDGQQTPTQPPAQSESQQQQTASNGSQSSPQHPADAQKVSDNQTTSNLTVEDDIIPPELTGILKELPDDQTLQNFPAKDLAKVVGSMKNVLLNTEARLQQYRGIIEENKKREEEARAREKEEVEKTKKMFEDRLNAVYEVLLTEVDGTKTNDPNKVKNADMIKQHFAKGLENTQNKSLSELNQEFMVLEGIYQHGTRFAEAAKELRERERLIQERLDQNRWQDKLNLLANFSTPTRPVYNSDNKPLFSNTSSRIVNPPVSGSTAPSQQKPVTIPTMTNPNPGSDSSSNQTPPSVPQKVSKEYELFNNLLKGGIGGPDISSRSRLIDVKQSPYARPIPNNQ